MANLKPNHGTITKVKRAKTKKGVEKFVLTTNNGATHWVGLKFADNYIYANDLQGKSPLTAMIGAHASWFEMAVNKGDAVLDKDGKPVMKDGQPQVYDQSGMRYEQLEVSPSESLMNRRSEIEDNISITKRFEGINIFSSISTPTASTPKKGASADDDENEEPPIDVPVGEQSGSNESGN